MDHQSYDPLSRYPPSKHLQMIPGCATFRLLQLILDPAHTPPSLLRDALLISIDLEYTTSEDFRTRRITQIGVATLDTKLLSQIDIDSPQSLRTAVQARCFSLCPKRGSSMKGAPGFLWGQLENLEHDEARTILKEILHDTRDAPNILPRNVILIGHAIHSDRRLLIDTMGYDIKAVPSVRAILDSGRMMCSAYDFGIATQTSFPLRFMLRYLGVHYGYLHNAGNDAMFTMKALLLMFANWRHQKGRYLWNILDGITSDISDPTSLTRHDNAEKDLLWQCQVELLAAIARDPWKVPQKPTIRSLTAHKQAVKKYGSDSLDIHNLRLDEFFESV